MNEAPGYQVHLSAFDGPLDLLLHLVRRAEVDLRDVRLADITDQYMRFMEQVDEIDLQSACSFLETASTLLLIKSRALLPRPPAEEVLQDNPEDPEAMLMENLRLYEAYKNAAMVLKDKEEDGQQLLSKPPDELDVEPAEVIRGDGQNLHDAFLRALAKRDKKREARAAAVLRIEAEAWTVDQQKKWIRRALGSKKSVLFTALFDKDASRVEIAVTFSAMLEMWNAAEVRVVQQTAFGAITVSAVDNLGICRDAG